MHSLAQLFGEVPAAPHLRERSVFLSISRLMNAAYKGRQLQPLQRRTVKVAMSSPADGPALHRFYFSHLLKLFRCLNLLELLL